MLGHIFYFFGLILFLTNLSIITKFQTIYKIKEWVTKYKKVTSKEPSKKDYKDKDFQYFSSYSSISIMNFLWMFFGLLSKSWYVFSIAMIFSLLINLTTKTLGEFTLIGKFLQLLKIIVISFTIGFLVINHFHLHLDIYKMITQ